MILHILLNLLNELGKEVKCEACRAFYRFFATSLINSIIQEHECKILFIIRRLNYFVIAIFVRKCPNTLTNIRDVVRCCWRHFIHVTLRKSVLNHYKDQT